MPTYLTAKHARATSYCMRWLRAMSRSSIPTETCRRCLRTRTRTRTRTDTRTERQRSHFNFAAVISVVQSNSPTRWQPIETEPLRYANEGGGSKPNQQQNAGLLSRLCSPRLVMRTPSEVPFNDRGVDGVTHVNLHDCNGRTSESHTRVIHNITFCKEVARRSRIYPAKFFVIPSFCTDLIQRVPRSLASWFVGKLENGVKEYCAPGCLQTVDVSLPQLTIRLSYYAK